MILSSGKKIYANGEIFGLTTRGYLTEGYDSLIFEDDDDDKLTREEKREIADTMIKRWTQWRDAL